MRFRLVLVAVVLSFGCSDDSTNDAGLRNDAGGDAAVADARSRDAGAADGASSDARLVDVGLDASPPTDVGPCPVEECVDVIAFEANSNAPGSIEVSVQLSANAPCEVTYRLVGEEDWTAHSPAEDSSMYGADVPHVQRFGGLAPGEYEVRARDHLGATYTTTPVRVLIEEVAVCEGSWALPSGIAYGSWSQRHWDDLFPGLERRYGDSDRNVQTVELDGRLAQIQRVIPTPPGSSGSSRVSAAWDLPPRRRYRLSQTIRLPEDFAAGVDAQSGKLGWGLGGGTVPSGGEPNPGGFLVRVTYRGDRVQPDTRSVVSPHMYIYSADQEGRYGDEVPLRVGGEAVEFVRGEWMEVDFEVVVNSAPGAADGELRVWVDGSPALEIRDRIWFGEGTPQIDRMTLSTFHGGADSRWAPSATNEIAFADHCLN